MCSSCGCKSAETGKKNCGCGQDPCKTYGAETFEAKEVKQKKAKKVIESAMKEYDEYVADKEAYDDDDIISFEEWFDGHLGDDELQGDEETLEYLKTLPPYNSPDSNDWIWKMYHGAETFEANAKTGNKVYIITRRCEDYSAYRELDIAGFGSLTEARKKFNLLFKRAKEESNYYRDMTIVDAKDYMSWGERYESLMSFDSDDMIYELREVIIGDKGNFYFNAETFEARENKDGTIVLTNNEWDSCIHLYNGNYLWGDLELKLIDDGLKNGAKFKKETIHGYEALRMIHLYERLLRKRNVRSYPNPNKRYGAESHRDSKGRFAEKPVLTGSVIGGLALGLIYLMRGK